MAEQWCNLVRDLLPLVQDGVASEESRAFVEAHLLECEACRRLSEESTVPGAPPVPDNTRILSRIKQGVSTVAAGLLLCGALAGIALSGSEALLLNILLMPVLGAGSYFLFRKKCPICLPVLFLISQAALLANDTFGHYSELLQFSCIYTALSAVGMLSAFLLHYAFSFAHREVSADKLPTRKNAHQNRPLRIFSATLGLLLIAGCLLSANRFLGNPLSRSIAQNDAKKHITSKLSALSLVTEDATYDADTCRYTVRIHSKSSADTYFMRTYNALGKCLTDSYEEQVVKGKNTHTRLEEAYNESICYLQTHNDWLLSNGSDKGSFSGRLLPQTPYALDIAPNLYTLSQKDGLITGFVTAKKADASSAAWALLQLRKQFDKAGIGFHSLTLHIDGVDGTALTLQQFPYTEITETGLEEKIKLYLSEG